MILNGARHMDSGGRVGYSDLSLICRCRCRCRRRNIYWIGITQGGSDCYKYNESGVGN
jgi:hypothetical protein